MTTDQFPPPYTGPPPPGPPRRGWVRRHPIWSGAIAVFLGGFAILVIVGALATSAVHQAARPNGVQPPAASASATTATPAAAPAPPGPQVYAVGDALAITQNGTEAATMTVTKVTATTLPADPQYGSRPANGWYVTVRVKFTVSPGFSNGFDVNPLDFYAVERGGEHFDEANGNSYDAPGSGSELGSPTLGAGETARGALVFDLPRPHGKIAYSPNYEGGPLGYVRF